MWFWEWLLNLFTLREETPARLRSEDEDEDEEDEDEEDAEDEEAPAF